MLRRKIDESKTSAVDPVVRNYFAFISTLEEKLGMTVDKRIDAPLLAKNVFTASAPNVRPKTAMHTKFHFIL